MRISWRLCNNSEIHLWLWKVWSLVVCSQSSFYITKARKDDEIRQNTLFLRYEKINLVPSKQLLPNVTFQSTNYRKKELCVDNKVQEALGDVLQHAETKSVFTFQPIKRLVSTTVKNAKPAATF